MTAQSIISQLLLQPHPEGGFYRETYRAGETLPAASLPPRFGGQRSFSTAIYFLLPQGNFSAFHRIKSDECWHFYAGGVLLIHEINTDGNYTVTRLGAKLHEGETFQHVVPAGSWFASEPAENTPYSFVGCTVAPGFDFADFEMAVAADLSAQFPQHNDIIRRLCRL